MTDSEKVDSRPVVHSTLALLLLSALNCSADSDVDGPGVGVDAGEGGTAAKADGEARCEDTAEDCTNRVDDDCDGMEDCADSDCSAYKCTKAVPEGWNGHIAFYEGAPEAVPDCPGEYPELAFAGGRDPAFGPASCSACSCGPSSGAVCGPPAIFFLGNTTCSFSSSGVWHVNTLYADLCTEIVLEGSSSPKSLSLQAPSLTNPGTCAPSGGVPSTQPPSWNTLGFACLNRKVGGGCSVRDSECVPKPTPGFFRDVCIYRDGDEPCPPSFVNKSILYRGYSDRRTCSACTCDAPSGGRCSFTLTISQSRVSLQECRATEPDVEVIASQLGCYGGIEPIANHFIQYEPGLPGGGACGTQGGQPVGSVEANADTTITVCCETF